LNQTAERFYGFLESKSSKSTNDDEFDLSPFGLELGPPKKRRTRPSEMPFREFVEHCRIEHPIEGTIPLRLFPYQVEMAEAILDNRCVILNCGRQLGKTEIVSAILLYRALTKPNQVILITANKFSQAKEIMSRVRFKWERDLANMEDIGVKVYRRDTIEFDNGSKILTRAITPDTGRGLSIDFLYVDEMDYCNQKTLNEFWTAICPCLCHGSKVVLSSTPNDDPTSLYYTLWSDQVNPWGWTKLKYTWKDHPDRDEAWATEQKRIMGETRFRREHEAEFV
jgi:hypothetical protein